MKTMKKLFSLVAVGALVMTMLPSVAFAADSVTGPLESIMAGINEESTTINVTGEVTWTTGASHGSTPLIAKDNEVVKEVIIDGGSAATSTFKADGKGVGSIRAANGATLVFKNLTFVDESVSYAENAWEFMYLEFAGKLRFENCVFKNGIMTQQEDGEIEGDAQFVNCTFNSNRSSEYGVWVYDGNATFTNCTFEGPRGLKTHEDYGSDVHTIVVDNCMFKEIAEKPGVVIGDLNTGSTVEIKNSTFDKCQAGDQSKYIYESDTDVTTFNFVLENNKIICATHTLTKIEGVAAVPCQKDGKITSWYCEFCEQYFKDEKGTEAVTEEGLVVAAGTHTYKDGVCTKCNDVAEVVTPVVEKEAVETATKEVEAVVEDIVAGKETDAVDEKTAEAIKNVPQGNEIVTEVVAEVVTEEEVKKEAAADVKAIDETIGEDGEVAQYLDLSVVIKSIAPNGDETELGTLNKLSKPIPITLVIPEDLQVAGRTFYVIRVHDGEVDKLPLTKNADGSYTFTTDRFSTYALAYEDGAPNTGDNSAVMTYAVLAVAAMAVVVVLKRRNLFAK